MFQKFQNPKFENPKFQNRKLYFTLMILAFLISSNAYSEILPLEVNYLVPTQKVEEQLFQEFKLENYEVETFANGDAVMRFDLPVEMTGVAQQKFELKLTGKINETTKVLSGPKAKAVCQGPWKVMECSIGFTKLESNKYQLRKELLKRYDAEEAQSRYQLLSRFVVDPIGMAKVIGVKP